MESLDPSWAALPTWTVGMDERGLAAFHELAMARAPLWRATDPVRSTGGCVRRPDKLAAGRDRPGPGSRAGKRW
jgi:hypothetical protein